jgi:PKD repeat protein
VLARVNAGGPTLPSGDAGPDWTGDETASPSPRHNGGSNAAGWAPVGSVDGTVPPTTPTAVFDTERWDPGDAPEMSWDFPVAVPNGTPLQVRLYFAARCDCTNDPGERIFDVNVEGGSIELDNYDIVADVGFNRGTMKAFNISSDGNVDIDFGHGVENPLINAIEILRTDVTAPTPPSSPTDLRDIFFDGDDADPAVVRTQAQTGIDWSTVRGATMLDGNVYTGHADGSFVRRSFNGTTFGAPVAMDLQDQIVRLDAWHTDVQRITGMFFDKGRLYYTITGSASLFYRYFTPENSVVGAARFTASNNVTGIDFARISGMFLAGGKLYFANTLDGNLRSIDWNGSAPVAGTAAVVAGDEGNDWRSRGMFVYTGSNLPGGGGTQNQAPTANASMNCSGLTCQFNGTGSSDPENGTLQYAWTFGDGQTSTAASGTVTYPAAGTYTVRLTVTDPQGASNTTEQSVTVSNSTPPTGDITFVGSSTTNGNWTTYRVDVPAGVAAGDGLLLVVTTGSDVTVSPPAGWTQVGTVAASGSNNGGTTVWRRVAAAGDAGQAVTVTLSAIAKTGVTLLAYHGTSTANPVAQIATAAETVSRTGHTTPGVTVATAGSVVVSYWSDRNSNTTAWTEPAGEVNRAETQGAGGGHISTLATDSNGPVAAGPRAGLTATADAAGARATMVTIVLAPA